jgi:CheY-like chemotaxis protein
MPLKKPTPKYTAAMLIDDNEIDNFISQKMIEECNFAEHIYINTNATSALEFLKNLERLDEKGKALFPDIIFLDLNMPIIDGYQFINEFEKLSKSLISKTKIIILTTSVSPEEVEKCKTYPRIVKFVNKPLSEQILNAL